MMTKVKLDECLSPDDIELGINSGVSQPASDDNLQDDQVGIDKL